MFTICSYSDSKNLMQSTTVLTPRKLLKVNPTTTKDEIVMKLKAHMRESFACITLIEIIRERNIERPAAVLEFKLFRSNRSRKRQSKPQKLSTINRLERMRKTVCHFTYFLTMRQCGICLSSA